jgi:formamidopyrimidine-DNA glycosylase
MPELPEVETIRRQLAPRLAGRRIEDARVLDPLWCAPAPPEVVESSLRGRRIVGLARRGKYLVLEVEPDRFLVMHLRMTGNLLWAEADDGAERPHLRFRLALEEGGSVLFVDVRRFGTGILIDGSSSFDRYLGRRLGPEPLDPSFTPEVLARQAEGRRTPVKAFLLAQDRVAGIGNIYADEALFRARIHPLKPAGRLRRPEIERLHQGISEALGAGIESFGASIDRYRDANGARGGMQNRFLVHRRAGEPCPRCGSSIIKIRAAGRGTYLCRRCQRAPVRSRRAAAQEPAG